VLSSQNEPVLLGGEENDVNGAVNFGLSEEFTFNEVPDDSETVSAAATMYCKPKVEFSIKKWTVEGKAVLEVIIPKSPDSPHFAEVEPKKWMAYIRVKDENILASSIHLKVWKNKQQERGIYLEFSEKEKLLLKYLEDHPNISVSKFCKIGLLSRHTAEDIIANLISLGLIEPLFHEQHFLYRRTEEKEKTPEPSRLAGRM
jgi:predicted HTH transcriptional regulator